MPDGDESFGGSLVFDFRKWWRREDMETIYIYCYLKQWNWKWPPYRRKGLYNNNWNKVGSSHRGFSERPHCDDGGDDNDDD